MIPLLLCVQVVSAQAPNLLINGSFEASDYPTDIQPHTLTPAQDGWSGTGNFIIGLNNAYASAQQGAKRIIMNTGSTPSTALIEQVVAVETGKPYELTFWSRQEQLENFAPQVGVQVSVIGNGGVLTTVSVDPRVGVGEDFRGRWQNYSLQFVANASSVTVRIRDISTLSSGSDVSVDNFTLREATAAQLPLVNPQTLLVADPNNVRDTRDSPLGGGIYFGSVGSLYAIGKFEVTLDEYTAFLNATARASDPYGLYSEGMGDAVISAATGIDRQGEVGAYNYSVIGDGRCPVFLVSWFDAARFCNWLHNGGTNGASTETGAYTLNGATGGIVMKNADARWWIPSEDEWYKAAYYKGGGTNSGYWLYPTQSDTPPSNVVGDQANRANYQTPTGFSLTQSPNWSPAINYLTPVGTFAGTRGAYGTFDQAGNVFEWTDAVIQSIYGPARGIRGGAWNFGEPVLQSHNRDLTLPENKSYYVGFRVASSVMPDTDGDGLTDEYEMGYGRYYLIPTTLGWNEAKADAESRGGHLGTITSEGEWQTILNILGSQFFLIRQTTWLGGQFVQGQWNWLTGEAWSYSRWRGGEPNYGFTGCLEITSDQGFWNDTASQDTGYQIPNRAAYLLEFGYSTDPNKADTDGDGVDDKIESDLGSDPNDPNAIPAEYAATLAAGTTTVDIVRGAYTWNQAKTDAVNRGGRLAVFPTGDVYDRIVAKIRNAFNDYFWLGGSDVEQEGVWRWIDGTPITYGRWQAGEPSGGSEDSLHVVVGSTIWNDATNDGEGNWMHAYALETRPLSLLSLPFVEWGAQWSVDYSTAHDEFSSAKAQTTDGQSTYREYTVAGPAVVDFWWKVSSEELYDTFAYSVNGVNQQTISGEVDWTYRTLTLPEGTHTIRWTYTKDESGAVGQDAGWLDDFVVYPATAALQISDGSTALDGEATVDFGSADTGSTGFTRSLTFANEGDVPLEVQLSLPDGSPFAFDDGATTYALLLGRGESVDVPIVLSTAGAGTKTAQLTISAPDSTVAPPLIALTGYVRGPDIGLTQGATELTSGQAFDMGLAPRTVEFTIRNNGNVGDLVIASISATGNFQITQQPATTIPPQTSTTFKVLAQSVASGVQSGSISITSNAANLAEFSLPLSSKSLIAFPEGIADGSMATSGTGGAAGWDFVTTVLPSGQSGSALKTGATPSSSGSVLEFSTETAGVLSWTWKVSTQENFDWLLCEVDGQEVAGISTKNGVWQTQVVNVPAGATIRWVYRKDASGSIGEDAGYLVDVEFRNFAANQSFGQWAQTHGVTDPQQRMPKSGLPAMFGWLGGFRVDGDAIPDIIVAQGRLTYRYPISKTADGTQQILYSGDMSAWTTRRISQHVVSEDADRVVIEATAPSGTKGFFKVVGAENNSGAIVWVQGGALPQPSAMAGTAVASFQIGRTEVTTDEWEEVVTWALSNGYTDLARGNGTNHDHPVRYITWYDVVKWSNAKSEMDGLTPVYRVAGAIYRTGQSEPTVISGNGYRLPTEAEWEWAARGGVSSRGYVYSGSNDVNEVAWYNRHDRNQTKAVGTETAANELGIYDMSGNVWEWCEDAGHTIYRRIRGGSWIDPADFCTVSSVSNGEPSTGTGWIGFRLARNAED